jgi:hypothetical protein
MATSAASWQVAWQVHFTRHRLAWPAEPRPLLGLWEPGDLAAWLDAEDIPDGCRSCSILRAATMWS